MRRSNHKASSNQGRTRHPGSGGRESLKADSPANQREWTQGTKVHSKNLAPGNPMRGGIRL